VQHLTHLKKYEKIHAIMI